MDEEERKKGSTKLPELGLKDYLALTIAAMETFLFPLIILSVVLFAFAIFFALRP